MFVQRTECDEDGNYVYSGPEGSHCVYCLESMSTNPNSRGLGYIGYTPDPANRILQHNGEIAGQTARTKRHRPWTMLLFVAGFANEQAALITEASWTHPLRTRLRDFMPATRSGWGRERKAAYVLHTLMVLLRSPPWNTLPLSIHICDHSAVQRLIGADPITLVTSFDHTYASAPLSRCRFARPLTTADHRRRAMCAKRLLEAGHSPALLFSAESAKPCPICFNELVPSINSVDVTQKLITSCPSCNQCFHLTCLAKAALATPLTRPLVQTLRHRNSLTLCPALAQLSPSELDELLPASAATCQLRPVLATCPICRVTCPWSALVRRSGREYAIHRALLGSINLRSLSTWAETENARRLQ